MMIGDMTSKVRVARLRGWRRKALAAAAKIHPSLAVRSQAAGCLALTWLLPTSAPDEEH